MHIFQTKWLCPEGFLETSKPGIDFFVIISEAHLSQSMDVCVGGERGGVEGRG